MLKNLEANDGFPVQFGDSPLQMRETLLLSSLAKAYSKLAGLQGSDESQWHWGNTQKTMFAHAFSKMLDEKTRNEFDVGPLPRGGSANTVNQSSYGLKDFVQTNGPSFRVVIDVGNWDQSMAVNTPGQSGDPASPHYRDLAEKWAKGDYFPMLYSRKAVEAATAQKIILRANR
jgi:penicillin amidase